MEIYGNKDNQLNNNQIRRIQVQPNAQIYHNSTENLAS
jgi:hypothetical protein